MEEFLATKMKRVKNSNEFKRKKIMEDLNKIFI